MLDEPTSDLDVETLDLLQDILGEFDGTVLLVSHDRDYRPHRHPDRGDGGDGRATVYPGGLTMRRNGQFQWIIMPRQQVTLLLKQDAKPGGPKRFGLPSPSASASTTFPR